ncbi:hypothetical protein Bca52824_076695 [Brassica carinata]|uniref:Uncharacterized protein n=1 Tax=Brassica carinata TaxID=52824 RepID=A0A8X7TXS8_BRACI|nr:hypothetical protein Bca52824_076695 [Brassica carinata]
MAELIFLAHFPSMLHGSYYGVLDIESPADEFVKYFTRKREWKCYNHGSFSFSAVELRFQIESENLEKKTVKMSIFWNHISDFFKVDYNNGSHVKWTIDAENISDNIQDPDLFLDTAVSIYEDIRYKLPNKYALSQELHLDIGPARFAHEIKLRKKPFERFIYV